MQEKRTAIEKEFHGWLKDCHEKHDKQVKFSQFGGTISRPELQKNRQNPWGVFTQIEWDGKVFKKGQLVSGRGKWNWVKWGVFTSVRWEGEGVIGSSGEC